MKKITVKPAEEIQIIDPVNEKEYIAVFNMRAVAFFQECQNREPLSEKNILGYVLYASINAGGAEIDFDSAMNMADKIDAGSGIAIINVFMDSLIDSMDAKQKKNLANILREKQILTST